MMKCGGEFVARHLAVCTVVVLCLLSLPDVHGNSVEASTEIPEAGNATTGFKYGTISSKDFYQKMYKFMKQAKFFQNFTFEDAVKWIDDAETWTPPAEIQKRFPYYLAGYDFEDRPVWVVEAGKYYFADLIRDPKNFEHIEKYCFKAAIHVCKSAVEKDTAEKEIRQASALVDCQGFDMTQVREVIRNPKAIDWGTRSYFTWSDLAHIALGKVVVINANYGVRTGLDLIKPFAGSLFNRITILGNNPYKWKAELQRLLPAETIPTWYGGSQEFKPLAVYG